MARVGTLQASFSSGELSPRLYGRADIAKYASGAELIQNYIVRPEGGLMRRHGTRFTGEVNQHSKKPRLKEFIFSNAQAYMLVFEDSLIRFYKNGAPITSSTKAITGITNANPAVVTSNAHGFVNGDRVLIVSVSGMGQVNNREFTVAGAAANTFQLSGVDSTAYDAYTSGGTASKIYTVTSPYLEADLGTLLFAQSADVIYITHNSYAPRTLSRLSDTSWALAAVSLQNGPFTSPNTNLAQHVMCIVSGSNYDPGDSVSIQSNADIFAAGDVGSYFYMTERYYADNAVVPWTVNSNAVVAVGDQQSNDNKVYEAVVGNQGTGPVPPTHTDGEAWDNMATSVNRWKWRYLHSRYAIVSIDSFTDSKNVSGKIKTRLPNGLAPIATAGITNCTNSGGLIRVTVANNFGVGDYVYISGVTGTVEANGSWRILNANSTRFDLEGSTFVNAYLAGGTAKRYATYNWRKGAFSTTRGYPACVALHEQRLCYASTAVEPTTLWASKSGDYANFLPGTNDDDPIVYTIAANQVDPVRWLSSSNDLLLGTMAQEMAAYGGGLGDPITPTNTRIVPQSGEGSAKVRPVKVGNDVLFVNRAARKLFALRYGTDGNAYSATDLLELAEHLTLGKTITDVAWAKNPLSVLWCLCSDGSLISLTYRPDQQVIAWSRHVIDGTVESIAVIPSTSGTTDQLWLAVNRTIDGSTKRYVEYLADPFEPTSTTDKANMGFVDCALQYSGAATTILSGLYYLEGKTVKIVGNGFLLPDQVVTNGKITLAEPVTSAWVGLAYTSKIRTLRPEGAGQVTAQGKTKRTPSVTVRVHNAIGGTIGPGSESVMDELVRRDLAHAMDASPPMFSGDVDAFLASDFDLDGRIAIVQSDPLPLDILAVMPLQSVSER